MKWARNLSFVIIAVMTLLLANILVRDGLGHGVGFDTFLAGIRNPWQAFIDQDLVSGLMLTAGWIIYRQRERPVLETVAWIWMAAWWGNIVVAAYVLIAARQSADAKVFFCGEQAAPSRPAFLNRTISRIAGSIMVAMAVGYLVVGFQTVHGAIAVIGSLLAFLPIILSGMLLFMPPQHRQRTA